MGGVSQIGVLEGANAWAPRATPWPEPTKKVIVVASARNEGVYLLEWVAHYLLLGADSILIYTNDNSDGSDELLCAVATHVPQVSVVFNETPASLSAQRKAYQHAMSASPLVAEHEWAAVVDLDELALPRIGTGIATLPEFVALMCSTYGASAIRLNWQYQFDAPSLEYRSDPVGELYPIAAVTRGVKSIFRLRDFVRFRTVHRVDLLHGKLTIDGAGRPVGEEPAEEAATDLGCIRHYWHRSFVEFDARIARGIGTQPVQGGIRRSHADYFSRRPLHARHDPLDAAWLAKLRESLASLRSIASIASAESQVRERVQSALERRARELRPLFESLSRPRSS